MLFFLNKKDIELSFINNNLRQKKIYILCVWSQGRKGEQKMSYVQQTKSHEEYLRMRNYSENTIHKYISGIKIFVEYLEKEKSKTRIQDVTKEDLRDYQSLVYSSKRKKDGKSLSISSKALRLTSVKSLFKHLVKQGELVYNIASEIEIPWRDYPLPKEILSEREMEKLLNTAKGKTAVELRDRTIMEVLYSTGIRNSELRNLKALDIDLEKQELFIERGKGGKSRVVPMGRLCTGYLELYIDKSRPKLVQGKDTPTLFLTYRGKILPISHLAQLLKCYAIKAGIKKNVTAHMLRHTCATHLLRGGADIRYVQELLGHEALSTTERYTKIEITDLKRVHARTHPREQ